MKRKTIKIAELVDTVNHVLKHSDPELKELRRGMMIMLETVLFKTGNYSGYRYLTANETDYPPGINLDEHGNFLMGMAARFANTDSTRVEYN